ncbi:Transposon TX1 uncharacterized 149 kDa protein ORF 2 [Takifugu flavidus]|uniref:Transposon TX1 uncharacterized 149 kDa protein ORF 2 n=1 Tax=Takifugu flavidus TaxID=433684 RepID=A0A5C6P4X0_9TELE|nr:Transposon TX1 uncharacterized 149 kDa protein ORF 2 [Takifugu flavidus]
MGETVELGETGETGDRIQTGEQGTVGQVMGGLDGPGIVAGERAEGEVSTGERGEGEVSTGERGEGAVSTGEQGEGAVSTGERGEGGVSTGERGEEAVSAGEGTSGASEWWLVPARRRNKRKSAMKDKGGKTGRLEETVADTDTSDCESMSDGSELSGTTPDGQDFDLYPPGLFKKFLTQTKGMKGLDLGTYFPDRLCFIRDAKKRALVFDTAKRKRIDVLFLQETHSDCGIEVDWEKEWEGQVLLSHNTTLSGGVGLLFSRGFTPSSLEVEHVWWDRGKVEMQLLCQQYTLNATQDTRRSIKDLEMEIVELEAIGSSTGDRGCIETLQSKKMALASLLDSQFLLWAGEKAWTEPNNPFTAFEHRAGTREPGQIRQRAVEFFSSLYEKCVEASGRAVPSLECSTALSLEPLLSRVRANVDGLFLPSFYRKIVLSAYADDLIVMVRSQRDVDVLSNLTVLFNRLSAARVNWQKSEALAVGRWTNGLPVLPQDLAWRRDGLKYLGVFIGDEETEKKNWLDTLEKVDGKIQKWKWLLPRMSYRGRTLVLNNLVASVLWHRLSCMEPPSGLLAQLQTRVLAFFWDSMHWVQQGVCVLAQRGGRTGPHPPGQQDRRF